ncbi:MAG: hypothetical protein RL095_335 [Verrucomicrobiota bacterium]|jgi:hypothetical protein
MTVLLPILLLLALVFGFGLGFQKIGFLRTCLAAVLVFLFGSQLWVAGYALKELTEHSSIDWQDMLLFFLTQLLLLGSVFATVKMAAFFKNRD